MELVGGHTNLVDIASIFKILVCDMVSSISASLGMIWINFSDKNLIEKALNGLSSAPCSKKGKSLKERQKRMVRTLNENQSEKRRGRAPPHGSCAIGVCKNI